VKRKRAHAGGHAHLLSRRCGGGSIPDQDPQPPGAQGVRRLRRRSLRSATLAPSSSISSPTAAPLLPAVGIGWSASVSMMTAPETAVTVPTSMPQCWYGLHQRPPAIADFT